MRRAALAKTVIRGICVGDGNVPPPFQFAGIDQKIDAGALLHL